MAFCTTPLRAFCFLTLACLFSYCSAAEPAWNGHITPGSTKKAPLTPYYVPPGAKGYDSESPLVLYSGTWTESFSSSYVGNSIRTTTCKDAAVVFKFTGTGIEWFGNSGRRNGVSRVYIDGKHVRDVDAYSDRDTPYMCQRNFWAFGMEPGTHTIKIINSAQRDGSTRDTVLDLDAFVVTNSSETSQALTPPVAPSNHPSVMMVNELASSQWTLEQKGSTGVHAMQLAIISETHALIIDKVEHNPLTIDGHSAWAALYNLKTHAVKPLRMQSNSFCAGGTFLSNGTLINVGGNPVVEDHTSAADFGDVNGLQGVRLFHPCESESADGCMINENHSRVRMASPRWYNTVIRIPDGSAMIIGGAKKGGWINNATVNNPTIEYYPPKSIHGSNGMPIPMPFLKDTLNSNLFPIAFVLPDGKVVIVANRDAMIYDYEANTERRLPQLPNNVRVTYPMTGTALLLPLSPENGYTPEILICGGSTVDDTKPSWEISSQDPASSQCSRMVLTDEGISNGWQVEQMPQARTMPDAVLLPTGQIIIVNGAESGISGYGNVRNQVGASNADIPVLVPVLYDPSAPSGQRFSSDGMPESEIPRLYHSVATLTPAGDVMVTGSNPNLDRSELKYGTEYRVEWLKPPYMQQVRPEIIGAVNTIGFGVPCQLKMKEAPKPESVKGMLGRL